MFLQCIPMETDGRNVWVKICICTCISLYFTKLFTKTLKQLVNDTVGEKHFWSPAKYLFHSLKGKSIHNFFEMQFSGFFVVILTVQINLALKLSTGHFFVSGQTHKISRGSNIFFRLYYYNTIYYMCPVWECNCFCFWNRAWLTARDTKMSFYIVLLR